MTDKEKSDLVPATQSRRNDEIIPQKIIFEVVFQAIRDTVAKEQKT